MDSPAVGILMGAMMVGIVFGCASLAIAERKRRSPGGFFLVGFLLGPLGILAAVLAAPGEPAPPPGMRAVMCPRCNARQNIARDQADFECWQCKLVSQTQAAYRGR
ncbi:hypothetical protein ACWZHB_13760 [Nocardia sp. FBN12]|uniref:hypothetical protein n=1 Tax=Nocardia sp. FBN12 TaxID=3419766 RepID=UPI003D05C768